MPNRILKVNELIKRELGQLLLKEIDFPKDTLVTITRTEASVDLNQAKVYISIMPESQKSQVLPILKKQIYILQQKLNKRLKMRPTPRIRFLEEKQTSQAGRVEEILEGLKNREK